MSTAYGYSVAADLAGAVPGDVDDVMDELLEALADLGPVVSANRAGDRVGLRFSLVYPAQRLLVEVCRDAGVVIDKVLGTVGLSDMLTEYLSVETEEHQDRELAVPNFPELVGLAEIAEILKVSKQRVGQLREREDFPQPVAVLRSGPVWARPMLDRFIEEWPRRSGHPPTWWIGEHRRLVEPGSMNTEQLEGRLGLLSEELKAHFPKAIVNGTPDHFVVAVLVPADDETSARDAWFDRIEPLIERAGVGWSISDNAHGSGLEVRRGAEGAPALHDAPA